MELSSEEVARIEFSGTEQAYDRADVEAFRTRVIAALEAYEAGSTASGASELAEAQRVRQQAVHLAERMLRDVMSSSGDGTDGLDIWQDAIMLRAVAEEEMEYVREEARRVPAMAMAERDEIRKRYEEERLVLRRELNDELADTRGVAEEEAARIRGAAEEEAAHVLTAAIGKAEQARLNADRQLHRSERRLAVLRTALADAESRFRRLAATAANEAGTLAALADQDIDVIADETVQLEPGPRVTIDLTDEAMRAEDPAPTTGRSEINRNSEAGFYQRRLAGLRDRLEKSGNAPE